VPEKKTTKKTTTRAAATKRTTTRPTARKTVARKAVKPAAQHVPAADQPRVYRGHRKTKVGNVVSAKQAKTVIVEVKRLREHPLYKKVISVRKRFPAHDADGVVKAGDIVRIQESRPFSATKRWQVVEVISRAGEAMAAAPEVALIEKQLEESAGVTELLQKPERETPEPSAEGAEAEEEDSEE
jgi:small subunit ribosomal protein S17